MGSEADAPSAKQPNTPPDVSTDGKAACAPLRGAGAAVRLAGGRSRPLRMGLWSGGMFTLMMAGANAVLAARSAQLTALRLPFVALAGGWGSAGFYVSAALSYLAAATSLAGVAYALLPRKMMLNYENQSPHD